MFYLFGGIALVLIFLCAIVTVLVVFAERGDARGYVSLLYAPFVLLLIIDVFVAAMWWLISVAW